MSGAIVLVFLLFAVAIPLALWVAIESETSDPTVVDHTEAERIAKERGGRGRSGTDSSDHAIADRDHTDDPEPEWGAESGNSNRDDRWR